MDSDAPPDDSVFPDPENKTCEKKPPDRPSPFRHRTSPTVPTKPRPPLPAKPRPPIPKKPPIAHVKPIANSAKGVGNQKKSTLTRLDSTGKGKAPPPPPPAAAKPASPSSPTPAPRLPPKDCPPLSSSSESSISSSKSSESVPPNLGQSPSKTLPFAKNDIQTKILNSALQKKDDAVSPCKPAPKQPVKPSATLPALPPKNFVGLKTNTDPSPSHISEKHMKNKNNSSLHENLGLKPQDQPLSQLESDVKKNRPNSLVTNNRPPPPLKPKPKPRERPVPKRRVSVRNSSDSIGEPRPLSKSLPPPPPPPIPKSPSLVPVNNSIDTNNNNADSDCVTNDLSSDDDSWLDFKHDSLSLRSLENAVLAITGWHESNNNNLNNHTESPSSPKIATQRPPIPVRDYKLRSPSIDRCRSTHSESSITTTGTITVRTRSRSEVRTNFEREPIQLPRKSRPTPANAIFSDINQNTETTKVPLRPPRPKHEEIKRTRGRLTASDIQFVHVDFTSSQQAQELGAPILLRQKTDSKKVCPPKPQRKSLVRRSRSDATDNREPLNNDINSDTRSQKVDMFSPSPPSSPVSEQSDLISKPPIPSPPKRWYPSQSNDSDNISSLDVFENVSNENDYHEIIERRLCNSTALSTDSSETAPETLKEPTPPPPLLPPRNYTNNEEVEESIEVQNPPLPDRNYRENSGSSLSLFSSVQKHYVEMTGANGIDSSILSSNDTSDQEPPLSHNRPLSSVSQSSLPSDSGSGSVETGNTNLVLTSGSESSDEETESENEKGKRNAKKVFFIAQEIVCSERVFVNILRLLNVDFRKAVSDATEKAGRPVIPNDMLNRILDYLPQLQNFNEVLLHDLEERLKEWDKVQAIADIFVKKGPFLKLYVSYIRNFENTQTLFDECCKKYPLFADVVKEFQASPASGNLAIKHHMLKPIQRNPQYRLLLTDYLRYLEIDSPEYKNAQTALNIVSEVSNHANESMRQEDYIQKLMDIQYSLTGEFEVIKPGRKLIKMGELQKLSRKEMQPRVFILFNDTLLYTTPVAGGYKLNNVLKLAGMKVETPTLDDFKNEFSIISIQRSFTVCADTPSERDEWIEAFAKAIDENNLKRNSFEVNRTPVSALEKDFVLGAKAPLWVPDARVTMCMLCTCGFTVTWRRHHCRACGRVVCGNCSNNKAPLHYLENKSNRVCDECFKSLKDVVDQQIEQCKNAKEKGEEVKFPISPEVLLTRFQKIRISGRSKTYIHRPAWLKEVHANDQGSTMSGYLKIYKGKRWKRLWFVLKDKVLYKYKASEDTAAITSTPLLGYEVKRFTEGTSDGSGSLETNSTTPEPRPPNWFEGVEQGLVFELTHTGMPPMRFQTDSATATEKWVTVMREASVP